jgi:hypothetical protein
MIQILIASKQYNIKNNIWKIETSVIIITLRYFQYHQDSSTAKQLMSTAHEVCKSYYFPTKYYSCSPKLYIMLLYVCGNYCVSKFASKLDFSEHT